MPELRFEFCPFSEKLVPYVLDREPDENSVYVFPNENSAKSAVRYFQQKNAFSNTLLITIEELKNRVFLADRSLLREEKRTLAFYASLEQKDRDVFKLRSYFQSIELAHHFFTLWQEFNEECVNPEIVDTLYNEGNVDFMDWQVDQYKRLLTIREQYREFIDKKGFTDNLFVRTRDNINLGALKDYKRYIFVNQFYYTKLEKVIIDKLLQDGKEVALYYQIPAQLLDCKTLRIHPFQISDLLQNYSTQQIHVTECGNDFSVLVSMIETLEKHPVSQIIDPAFSRNSWSGMVSPNRFKTSDSVSFSQSSIYRFFNVLYLLLDSVMWEEERGTWLLPLASLLEAAHVPEFTDYFMADREGATRQQLLHLIYDLVDHDYKYIDMHRHSTEPKAFQPLLEITGPVLQFIKGLQNIHSLQEWIDLIDNPENGPVIRRIMTRDEIKYSNLADVFYRLLADIKSIESIGIVSNWDLYFNIPNPQDRVYQFSSSLLRIMIDYMKAKTFQWQTKAEGQRIEISSLNDTRNIHYQSVLVLNVIEGKIPSQRMTPFLFTDKQREYMGLKTWEDIRQREHYYFCRLVLTTPQVHLFTQKNLEKNIETSSFIEELLLQFPPEKLHRMEIPAVACLPVYRELFDCTDHTPDRENISKPEFYRIPLDVASDFPDGRFKLSFTSYKDLSNPFLFYIRDYCRVQEKPKVIEKDFSPRLIGNIAHDAATECWRLLNPTPEDLYTFDRSAITMELVRQAVDQVVERGRYYYSILHDYTRTYFDNITKPNLVAGLVGFFDLLTELGLDGKGLYVYPEEEESTLEEQRYKTLVTSAENGLGLDIAFRGRADLRIIDPDDKMLFIFDFKTGGFDREQLLIYELLYHLLQNPDETDYIQSWFYQLLKNESKELKEYLVPRRGIKTKDDLIRSFYTALKENAAHIADNGFSLPSQKSKLTNMPEITRKDLFLAQSFEDDRS